MNGSGVTLSQAAERGFRRYIELTESRMKNDLRPERFLWLDTHPGDKAKVRQGEQLILPRSAQDNGRDIEMPDALVQDWLGAIFIPKATIPQVRQVMQDYPEYKRMFAPEIIESRIVRHEGDEFEVFLRLFKKQILTVILNAHYKIQYGELDSKRMYIISHSTRIAEARSAKRPDVEYPVGDDSGFLWRLNSYWRFEEADGGVYAECEAVSLSRDVPVLGRMIRGFVEKFPKESMDNTLKGVRRAVTQK